MDHYKKKNNTILNPFSQIYSSKKAIKILLTLFLLCILFSYSSLLSSLFSTFSIELFSFYRSTDRNYIFLLCNGILILITKNSGLFAIAPSNTDHFRDYYAKKNVPSHQYSNSFREYNVKKNTRPNRNWSFSDVSSQTNAEEITKAVVEVDNAERAIITFTAEVGEEFTRKMKYGIKLIEDEEEEVDHELLNIVEEEEGEVVDHELLNIVEEEVDHELLNIVEEEEEEKEEEGTELLSREELNKKCEEFIRKMKYGIKFEAQHHHLIVK